MKLTEAELKSSGYSLPLALQPKPPLFGRGLTNFPVFQILNEVSNTLFGLEEKLTKHE